MCAPSSTNISKLYLGIVLQQFPTVYLYDLESFIKPSCYKDSWRLTLKCILVAVHARKCLPLLSELHLRAFRHLSNWCYLNTMQMYEIKAILFWHAFLPLFLLCSGLVIYYTGTLMIGQLDASSQLKDLAVFPIWPNRLGTSSVETDVEIGLRLSASYFSLKSAQSVVVSRGSTCSLSDMIQLPQLIPPWFPLWLQLNVTKAHWPGGCWGGIHVYNIWVLWFLMGRLKREKVRGWGVSPLFTAFVVVSCCSFGD